MKQSARRSGALPLLAAAVMLAMATGLAIASLRSHADQRRDVQVLLAALRGDVATHTSAIWQAIQSGDASVMDAEPMEDAIQARFDELAIVAPGEPMVASLIGAYERYSVSALDVLATAAGDDAARHGAASDSARDSSGALAMVTLEADAAYRQAAALTSMVADLGTTTILVSASVLLVLLFRRAERARRVAHHAYYDALTGLANRVQFTALLRAAMARAQRRGGPVAVLLLDLDRFKNVNDSLGHAAGDELLIGVADRLRQALRTGDVAARLAGDEFVVLVEDPRGPEDAVRVAERIVASLLRPFLLRGRSVVVSASIGIVCRPDGDGPEELLRDADIAMYRAKATGEHGYMLFEPEMHAAAMKRLQDEAELREAVEGSDFTLAYQPILDLATGRVLAVEALLRWRHPHDGDLSPARFIPIAEEIGLIHRLGWWAIETAAGQLASWRAEHPSLADLQVSVNLSARQLHDPELPDRIAALLAGLRLPAEALVLELTEGVFSGSTLDSAHALARLRGLGVKVAIDDFGTGYSTLGRLRDLPVDIIKIDRSFVATVEHRDGAAIVRTMIELAHALGLTCVGEGVERDAELNALRSFGCDAAQGYLFQAPANAAEISAWFGPAGTEQPSMVPLPTLSPG